jgi:hypothetical protein
VVVGTAGAVSGKQQQKSGKQQQAAPEQAQAAAAPAAPDYTAELQQLAQLQQQGVITQEEFEAKKKQILGI